MHNPKSEPEGPQDLSDEEIAWREKFWRASSMATASLDGLRLLAEVKRHRAQPADAAPLNALREKMDAMRSERDGALKLAETYRQAWQAALADAPRDRLDAQRVAMDALNEARARLGVDESNAAVREAWAQARSAIRVAFADPASPLRGMESAAAPIGAPDARLDMALTLLRELRWAWGNDHAWDDKSRCAAVAAGRRCWNAKGHDGNDGGEPIPHDFSLSMRERVEATLEANSAAASLEVEALGLSGLDEMLKDLADCRYLKQCRLCPDRVLKMRAALARAVLRRSARCTPRCRLPPPQPRDMKERSR